VVVLPRSILRQAVRPLFPIAIRSMRRS
jgi:hypothetical protein